MKLIVTNHKGFSLLELLLSVVVLSLLMAGAVATLDNWYESRVDREVAIEMRQLQNAAENYVDLNFKTFINGPIPSVGDITEIAITGPSPSLVADGFLPSAYTPLNSYKHNMRIFVRHATDTAAYGSILEVVTLSDGHEINDDRLYNTGISGGPGVGVVDGLNAGQIKSTSGAWTLTLSDFPAAADTYNIAAYGRVSDDEVLTEQYLFRLPDVGFERSNRMETNIDMNNNDIENADIVVVDSMNVANNATFGGLDPTGARSAYVLAVRDDFTTQNFEVKLDGDETKGNIFIDGNNDTDPDFVVRDTLDIQNNGSMTTTHFTTNSIGITQNAVFGDLDMANNDLKAQNIHSRQITLGSGLNSENLQITEADSLGDVKTESLVSRSLTVDQIVRGNFDGGIIVENNLVADQGANFTKATASNIATISNCINGCQ